MTGSKKLVAGAGSTVTLSAHVLPLLGMKRAALKRKSTLKKNPAISLHKLKEQLWDLCSQIIRKRYRNARAAPGLSNSNWQTGRAPPSPAVTTSGYLREAYAVDARRDRHVIL
jgi:hypothetical protein